MKYKFKDYFDSDREVWVIYGSFGASNSFRDTSLAIKLLFVTSF